MKTLEKNASGLTPVFPKLRTGLEPVHFLDQQGKKYYGLVDPLELSDEQVAMPKDLFYTLQFMDGRHSLATIQKLFAEKFGVPLSENRLLQLLHKLDVVFLFDNDSSRERLQFLKKQFRKENIREMRFADSAYPAEAHEFSAFWQDLPVESQSTILPHKMPAIIAPHIDIQLGAETYSKIYSVLPKADVYIILGISHLAMQHPFALTTKSFDTPSGPLATDVDFVNRIASRCQTDFFIDEIFHKTEHSIEFQACCLSHFGEKPFQIVPILCGFSYFSGDSIFAEVHQFVNVLKEVIQQSDKNICIIAGVDFAHVGPKYGDFPSPDAYFLDKVEKVDQHIFDLINQGNAQELLDFLKHTKNPYQICGFAALYSLLLLSPSGNAKLVHYNNAIMDKNRSTVTFAGILYS